MSNFAFSLNIPLWKLFRWFKRLQLWATGDLQLHLDNVPTHASPLMQRFLAKHQITQVTQLPNSPDLVPCTFWLFQKLKLPLKGKRFQTTDEIQDNTTGQLMEVGKIVWGPKVPTLKGTEASLSYVQCFLYLVSSSTNVSIFHITWLDTFWTELVYVQNHQLYIFNFMQFFLYQLYFNKTGWKNLETVIETLFLIVTNWKESMCLSAYKWMDKF